MALATLTALTILLSPPARACRTHRSVTTSQRSVWKRSGPLERAFDRDERPRVRSFSLRFQELAHDSDELVQPVVVQPVPSLVDAEHFCVAKGLDAAVLRRVSRLALLAVEKQGGTVDPGPQGGDVPATHVVRRPGAHVVVELPAIGTVLVLVDAVGGQVPCLLGGEVRIFILHAAKSVLDRMVAPGQPAGQAALLADPLVHAHVYGLADALREHARRRGEPLDGHE